MSNRDELVKTRPTGSALYDQPFVRTLMMR
jgi:hypothetical protein